MGYCHISRGGGWVFVCLLLFFCKFFCGFVVFLPVNFDKLAESKMFYFVGILVLVLVVKLPLTTSAEVPVQILVMVEFPPPPFFNPR